MSIADLWDRAWWSFMIIIFIGLLWLKFLDPYIACVWPGLAFALLCGAAYLWAGVVKLRSKAKAERQAEEE